MYISTTAIVPLTTRSGVPTPTIDTATSNSTLFQYVNDPILTSIRPFFLRISEIQLQCPTYPMYSLYAEVYKVRFTPQKYGFSHGML